MSSKRRKRPWERRRPRRQERKEPAGTPAIPGRLPPSCAFRNFGMQRDGRRVSWRVLVKCRPENSSLLRTLRIETKPDCFDVLEETAFAVIRKLTPMTEHIRSLGGKAHLAVSVRIVERQFHATEHAVVASPKDTIDVVLAVLFASTC